MCMGSKQESELLTRRNNELIDKKEDFITVVVPIRNEECFIASTLDQIISQDYPRDSFEILVVDGISNDDTRRIVLDYCREYPQIKLMDNPKLLSSAGRNVGFRNGKGNIFIVIDGHCFIPTDQLFKNTIKCFKESNAECLGRPQPLDPPNINDFQKAVAVARSSKIGHGSDSYIYSGYEGYVSPVSHGAVYHRKVFDKVGFIDERFDACEDLEFNYRVEEAGISAYMSPGLTVKYYPRDSLKTLFKQMVRYGWGRFRFLKKHSETFSLSGIAPFVFTLCIMFLPLLGFISSFFWWTFSIVYGFYFLIILSHSMYFSIKNGFKFFRYLPFIYFIIHFGLGWGFLKGVIIRK